MYVQDAPYCIQVEATEGCNLRCAFCGLNGIRGKNVRETDRYMSFDTADKLAMLVADAGWNPRIEFAMHGEPTLNWNLHKLIWAFRRRLPKAYILLTTNGDPLRTHPLGFNAALDQLFARGLNTIALDNYAHMKVAPLLAAYAEQRPGDFYYYPEQGPDGNPHKRRPHYSRTMIVVHDIADATFGTHHNLTNQGGNAMPLSDAMAGKRCALPFREIAVRWDGNVALCCNDWTGMFKVGNVNEVADIGEIWHHPAMYAARKHLLKGERVFRPCQGCTHRSERPGLLPDKYGKETYPDPTPEDELDISRALLGEPFTAPVARPWEEPGSSLRGRPLPVIR